MILKFLRKVPAGMMIVPLLIGSFMNTFFPEALKIGSFTMQHFQVQEQQQQWEFNYFVWELLCS